MFRLRATGTESPISNDKTGNFEDCLWELSPAHVSSHPAYQSPEYQEYIQQFRVGVFEHAPTVMTAIRAIAGLSDESICESFDPARNRETIESHAGNKGGRSSAFMYFTYDRNYILKTLSSSEVRFMQQHSEDFLRFFASDIGGASLLGKVLGVYTVHIRNKARIHIGLIENVFPATAKIVTLFDLKGSRIHRSSLQPEENPKSISDFPPGRIYKDLDFVKVQGHMILANEDWDRIMSQLEADSELLRNAGVIDYSILLGVLQDLDDFSFPERYRKRLIRIPGFYLMFGIIDFMQEYNARKWLERYAKNLVSPHVNQLDRSVTDPRKYKSRFIAFMKTILQRTDVGVHEDLG